MKTEQDVVFARAFIGARLGLVEGEQATPAQRAALSGVYSALCWVLEIPNRPAAQMDALLGLKPGVVGPGASSDLRIGDVGNFNSGG